MTERQRLIPLLCLALAVLLPIAACDGGAARTADSTIAPGPRGTATAAGARAGIVDSARTPDEDRRRFEAMIGPRPSRLAGGAESRDALVDAFLAALAAADTARLQQLALTAAEFGYLVYPHSAYARPPYRQPPELVWLQLSQDGAKGLARLLRPDVGPSLRTAGHECRSPAVVDGPTRYWRDCRVRVVRASGDTVDARLFGVIIEAGGHYKFVNYHTDL